VRETAERNSGAGVAAFGLHAPEFEHERNPKAVAAHARELGLDFPHLLDPDFAYWRALGNEYWPTIYLVDRCGRIRYAQIGEVHAGQASGRRLEARLDGLLAEGPSCR